MVILTVPGLRAQKRLPGPWEAIDSTIQSEMSGSRVFSKHTRSPEFKNGLAQTAVDLLILIRLMREDTIIEFFI